MSKENKTVELKDEELEKVGGGIPDPSRGNASNKKGWVCKNCGNIQGTWAEGKIYSSTIDRPLQCKNCGSANSFEERDVD